MKPLHQEGKALCGQSNMLAINMVVFVATAGLGIFYLSAIETEMREISEQDFPIVPSWS